MTGLFIINDAKKYKQKKSSKSKQNLHWYSPRTPFGAKTLYTSGEPHKNRTKSVLFKEL